jgi:hypothetical protein
VKLGSPAPGYHDAMSTLGDVGRWAKMKSIGAKKPSSSLDIDELPTEQQASATLNREERDWVALDPKNPGRPDNPPGFVDDEDAWDRAKASVKKHWNDYDEPYAVVMSVYKKMTGKD